MLVRHGLPDMVVALLLLLVIRVSNAIWDVPSPPVYKGLPSIGELAANVGVKSRDYLTTTEDGYILWLHRLGNNTGPPVLIQHGLFNAADLWINRGRDDLPFLLLDEGYDVYLGNQRGNSQSLNHVKYKRTDPRFWDYSFHEGGYFDLPAMIDKILKIRKESKLFYIGYSLGTTVFFVMASTRPEYNNKIQAAILLAPIAFGLPWDEQPLQLQLLLKSRGALAGVGRALRLYEIGPRSPILINQIQMLCGPSSPLLNLCFDIYALLYGEHRTNFDKEKFGYYASFSPAGTSFKTLLHLGQVYSTGVFKEFDYGPEENLRRYNRKEPPHYNLSKITAPVALFWSNNDILLSKTTIRKITSLLPNLVIDYTIRDPLFNHVDVVIGKNNKEELFIPVIETMNKIRYGSVK